tara:strand:+ start:656 stop:1636 length:981 start_codon:yes stop_codon:yes gene_type:complete
MKDYIIRKISNQKNRKYKHTYYTPREDMIRDKNYIQRIIKGIYIPPAYDNVIIYTNKKSKVRAIGYDKENRKQYIYNKDYIKKQKDKKFNHMVEFGKQFSKINRKINEDLYSTKDSKEKQIAIILKLIMECHFRIGNDKYSKKYKSYGTTTLENKHVKVKKDHVIIDFIGKKKVRNVCTVRNKKVVKTLREKKRTLNKNDRIFTYRKGIHYYKTKSSDVNRYLKQFGKFTAKNFRTWGANIEFIVQVNQLCKQKENTKDYINECVKKAIHEVACKLHNTYSVCKANYIDPELVNHFIEETKQFLEHFNVNNKEELYQKYVFFLENL